MVTTLRFLLFMFFYLIFSIQVNGQQFGGNPFPTRWQQINSDTARIIFPKGLDSLANRVASLVNELARHRTFSLGNRLNKINIVLQNQPVITNGYVGMGPYRSEFYTMPSADNNDPSSLSWPTQLTVHEYRHVQQYNNFNNGLSRVMKKLFGQEGYALAVNAAIPNWFFEGDAVFNETILAPHGRGTLPFFLKAFPALWQSNKQYNWMKLRNGSYKDYVPNHYDLGYLLVNYGTQKYGYNFWRKVTHDASAYKGLFYPMQQAINKHSGQSYKGFRDSAFYYYKDIFSHQANTALRHTEALFSLNKKTLTNYYFPYQLSPDSVLYLKSSYTKRPAFYIKDKECERLIRLRDISIDEQFGYSNGKIVYAAYTSNPRWRWVSYSDLRLLDIKTGEQKRLSFKTRYFSPDISADGKRVVANKVALDGSSSLVVLNVENGALIKEINNNGVAYFSTPKILDSNTVISVLRNKDATTQIAKININTGDIENITQPSNTVIGTIDVKKDKVYFTAATQLKDELYYYDLKTQQMFKTLTDGVGSYFINDDFGKLSWSSFTADGFQLSQRNDDVANWQPISIQQFMQKQSGIVANVIEKQTGWEHLQAINYSSKAYSKFTNPFNLHSWRPNYSDPEFSFTIYGNNILNTTETQLYYSYNENDKTHTAGGSLIYGGLFPYINIGSDYTFNRKAMVAKTLKEWSEWNNYIGVSIPLSWVSNKTYKSFRISSSYFYRSDFNKGESLNNFRQLKFSYLSHGISWIQQVQTTVQDIYPRWGYSANAQFRHAINLYNSWQGYSGINLYLPGLFRTQSVVISGTAQYSGTTQRVFANRAVFARGFTARDSAGVFTTRINYHLPLFYPDWGFANIFYLQRIRANFFYDYSLVFDKNVNRRGSFQSAGTEVFFDTKWWNQHPLTFGFRVGNRITPVASNGKLFFELVLPTSLIPR